VRFYVTQNQKATPDTTLRSLG